MHRSSHVVPLEAELKRSLGAQAILTNHTSKVMPLYGLAGSNAVHRNSPLAARMPGSLQVQRQDRKHIVDGSWYQVV